MPPSGGAELPVWGFGGPAHFLVVDDDRQVRELLSACLQQEGFSVGEADGARTALLNINQRIPDLMMVDVSMPGMDGWEMLRKIREKLDVEDLPVVIFSGVVSVHDLQSAPTRGANAYFRKPFDPRKLVAQAKSLLVSG
jgi:DNA-binding response OmpR family regulator